MEFHDVLHGKIQFAQDGGLSDLLRELINTPEINRLRNMRQMNFDVPLIQELGRSRRLPHSIGVAHIANQLAEKAALNSSQRKVLTAASILHDAAIPPYGHLVESEFKSISAEFKHEKRVFELIKGTINHRNSFMEIVPGRSLGIQAVFQRHEIIDDDVLDLICPSSGQHTPISADVDIDNIDNVHRMAMMLGWPGVRENLGCLLKGISMESLGELRFTTEAVAAVRKWLQYREKIYTLIIAHPECVPYNALQADLVRIAVKEGIITPDHWYMTEPIFEERLRRHRQTRLLMRQVISGCEYQLLDYLWIKNFTTSRRLSNAYIERQLVEKVELPRDCGFFVWNEKALVSRKTHILMSAGESLAVGENSVSCMIGIVKKTAGRSRRTRSDELATRKKIVSTFASLFDVDAFTIDGPESYTGEFWTGDKGRGLDFAYT